MTSSPVGGFVSPSLLSLTDTSQEGNFSSTSYHSSQSSFTDDPPSSNPTGACYLVFESALMLLFSICRFCGTSSHNVTKRISGSFVQVTKFCEHCRKTYVWRSQPFIANIPAGNIFISAAILFSGSLPAKALHLFRILKCATITRKTFFRHQNSYLQPAVDLVWGRHRKDLLDKLRQSKDGLTLGGDGRADSPGHSAKYGSYTLLELNCNKVVDFQLVQVSSTFIIVS